MWEGQAVRDIPKEIQAIARPKLRMINNSISIADLKIPPSNRLVKLKGNLSQFYSIRINKRWMIIFKWNNGNASNVEIIDYH
ncbi:MAG: type II toxin-antitoxin system RelE/ParE family toxin [Flavobacteriales bacterium]